MTQTPLFNISHDYTQELKLRTVSIASTVLATAITVSMVATGNEYIKTLLSFTGLGVIGVSRLAEGARKKGDLRLQDVSDISDASFQQMVYKAVTDAEATSVRCWSLRG